MIVELRRHYCGDWITTESGDSWKYVVCHELVREWFPELNEEDYATFEVSEDPDDGGIEFTREGLAVYHDEKIVHHGYLYQGLRDLLPEGEARYVSLC